MDNMYNRWCRGVSMRSHNTGVVGSIPPCVTVKTPLARRAAGNHLIKSTSLEKTQMTLLRSWGGGGGEGGGGGGKFTGRQPAPQRLRFVPELTGSRLPASEEWKAELDLRVRASDFRASVLGGRRKFASMGGGEG